MQARQARPRFVGFGSHPLFALTVALATVTAACAGSSNSTGSGGASGSGSGGSSATGNGGSSSTGNGGSSSTGNGGSSPTGNGGSTGLGGSGAGGSGAGGSSASGNGGSSATGQGGSGTGGTGAGGATGFCPSGAIFCADFEEASGVPTNDPVGTATFEDPSEYGWTFGGTTMSAMALDSGMPYDGNQSLKIIPTSNFAIRTLAVTVPTTFWVRLYIKSDQAIGLPDHNSFFAAGLTADYSTAKNVEVSEQFGCVLLNASDALFPTGTTCGANSALSASTWHCMAAQFDGTTGNVQVFSGSTEIINAQGWMPAKEAFTTFSFGYFRYNSEPGSGGSGTTAPDPTVWYDDVVVSSSPLSCP